MFHCGSYSVDFGWQVISNVRMQYDCTPWIWQKDLRGWLDVIGPFPRSLWCWMMIVKKKNKKMMIDCVTLWKFLRLATCTVLAPFYITAPTPQNASLDCHLIRPLLRSPKRAPWQAPCIARSQFPSIHRQSCSCRRDAHDTHILGQLLRGYHWRK